MEGRRSVLHLTLPHKIFPWPGRGDALTRDTTGDNIESSVLSARVGTGY